ncbi:MAG: PQQ-binding-like beta-propeller repeat protein [Planctomycetota bacterium]
MRYPSTAWVAAAVLMVCAAPSAWPAVYIEDSPAAQELADEAADLLRQGRAGEAAQRLQRVIDTYPDKLMRRGDGSYCDARRWVRGRLAEDEALRSAYRRRFDAAAAQALGVAMATPGSGREPALSAVRQRYPWTGPGLDAALAVAGLRAERADPAGARRALDEVADHPDLPSRAETYHELQAWAAALAGDAAAVDASLAAIADATRRQTLASTLGGIARLTTDLDRAPSGGADARPPLDRPLWQVTLERSALQQQAVVVQPQTAADPSGAGDDLRPTLAGGRLMVNDNQRVVALDAVSGRRLWVYPETGPVVTSAAARQFGFGRVVRDTRRVAVRGDAAFAVLGYAVPWQGRRRNLTVEPTRLVRLDAARGAARWSVTPGDLDPALQRAAFHGTPALYGDAVIVMVRRSQASSFQDSYLLAVEADTGALRWRRHLASTTGSRRRNVQPALSSMTLVGDRVYFCDNLGAAAAIDADTGGVRWVRVLIDEAVDDRGRPVVGAVPLSPDAAPTLCDGGLVLPLRIDTTQGLVLDPETGVVRRRFGADSPLRGATGVLAYRGDLLVIGAAANRLDPPELRRLDGATFETRWDIEPAGDAGSDTPRGVTHAAVWGGYAVIDRPGLRRLDLVDLATGRVEDSAELPWSGRLTADGGRWVVASGQKLAGYLDWPTARAEMRRRAEAAPESPEPGLNLAMMAVNAGQPDAVAEGVDRALRAIGRWPREGEQGADRDRVFRELLAIAERRDVVEPAVIERLFDRLAVATQTPGELVAYNLARGDHHAARGEPDRAAGFYQAVLTEPARAGRAGDDEASAEAMRRGELAARQRLLDLVSAHGRGFYAAFDRAAAQELAALEADTTRPTSAFMDLARRYPLAEAAPRAVLAAARRMAAAEGGDTLGGGGAATQFRRAFHLAEADPLRAEIAGSLAAYHEAAGRPVAASRWLEQVRRDHPDLRPLRGGVATDPSAWLAELGDRPQGREPRPRLTPPWGEAVRLAGVLLPTLDTDSPPDHADGFVYRTRSRQPRVAYFDLTTRANRWEAALPVGGLRLVHAGPQTVVLWSERRRLLYGLDAATGEALWPPASAPPLLEDLGPGGLAAARRSHAGQIIELIEADFGGNLRAGRAEDPRAGDDQPPRVIAGASVVAVIDNRGRAFGLDRATGAVLWQTALPLDTVSHAVPTDDAAAVAGLAAPGTEAQAGRLMLLDLATGRLRFPPIETPDPILRLAVGRDGDLTAIHGGVAARFARRDGTLRWRRPIEGFAPAPELLETETALVLYGGANLITLDRNTGQTRHTGANPTPRRPGPATPMTPHRDRLIGVGPEGVAAFDERLDPLWHDALPGVPRRVVASVLGQDHVFAVTRRGSAVNAPLDVVAIELDTGRAVARGPLPERFNAQTLQTLRVLDRHLVLAGRDLIAVLPEAEGGETD